MKGGILNWSWCVLYIYNHSNRATRFFAFKIRALYVEIISHFNILSIHHNSRACQQFQKYFGNIPKTNEWILNAVHWPRLQTFKAFLLPLSFILSKSIISAGTKTVMGFMIRVNWSERLTIVACNGYWTILLCQNISNYPVYQCTKTHIIRSTRFYVNAGIIVEYV